MINVLIVEDEPDLLRRFSDAVASNSSLKICGAVGSVAEAKAAIDQQSPDVVLTDLGLPDGSGIEVIRYAVQANSACDVLVVTMFGDDGNVLDSIAAGAAGYLIKDAMTSDLVDSILEVRKGGSPISPAIARKVLQRFKVSIKPVAVEVENGNSQLPDSPLSKRETEILRLVATVREADTVARISGDEFVVMLENLGTDPIEAVNKTRFIAEKILESLGEPYALGTVQCTNTVSIGATLMNESHQSFDDLCPSADAAMYEAKKAGRNTFRMSTPTMQEGLF